MTLRLDDDREKRLRETADSEERSMHAVVVTAIDGATAVVVPVPVAQTPAPESKD